MKKVALLGSSGGNLFNLGGKYPHKLISEIINQLNAAEIEVSDLIFIGSDTSMDKLTDDTMAQIYTLNNGTIVNSNLDKLNIINDKAIELDKALASKIVAQEIDGIIYISADPEGINDASVKAAVEAGIPVTGTGGTAMGKIQASGVRVIAMSGTTGTTNRTRAISVASAFAKEFNLKYSPVIGKIDSGKDQSNIFKRINIRGIMMSSLPGFIAMALILAISKIPAFSGLSTVFDLLIAALPVIVATIAAYQISGLEEVGIVSGIIAGALSVDGGIIGGILAGIIAGILAIYLIKISFRWNVPGTTANIIAGGISGLIAGLLVYFLLAPIAVTIGDGIRNVIQAALDFNPILAGIVAGALIWPAIMGGIYHAAILPIVLLEMEANGMSFLGAIDMVALVMVSAGITLGNILFLINQEDRAIALPGFLINVIFGTFVEAAYPFMLSSKIVFWGAIVSGAIGGAIVGFFNVQGTAYVPAIVAPALSNEGVGMLIAMVTSLIIGVIVVYFANKGKKID